MKPEIAHTEALTVFCWNVGNPSLKRAEQQAVWLRKQPADILVLTECKDSEGCAFLERYFLAYRYYVAFPKPQDKEYGVLIASRHAIVTSLFSGYVDYIRSRAVSIVLPDFHNTEVIGVYIPSRNASIEKKQRKSRFIDSLLHALEAAPNSPNRILCGDLNILEPEHVPHYGVYEPWEYGFYKSLPDYGLFDVFRHFSPMAQEYSWVGRYGAGYRYDHCFLSASLLPNAIDCQYMHEPRFQKLSDHSALVTRLSWPCKGKGT